LSTRPKLLALVPPAATDAVEQAAGRVGFDLERVASVSELFTRLGARRWDVTLVSLSVGPMDEAVARRVGGEANAGALVLAARRISLDVALRSEWAGAVALLQEPLESGAVEARLREAHGEVDAVPFPPPSELGSGLIGESPAMAEVFATVARVAASSATVLLTGESGTGKEVVARALHEQSDRRQGAFVAVNCAAIPEQLLESELFGHEKGAFTGAVGRRTGKFERADGGTLFLDEIGDMSVMLQAKVLRALEEGSVERVGAESPTPVDVRTVAATNRVLADLIEEGRFREDLYYRLAVVELGLPPLRERREDIGRLALHFAARFAERYDRPIRALSRRALARLEAYDWPGNVRELRNVMDRAVLLSTGELIRASALRLGAGAPTCAPPATPAMDYPVTRTLADIEAEYIARVLEAHGGHLSNSADVLGIHRNTLRRKLREYGLEGLGGERAS
jgi:two-component system response regulator HydG